MAYPWSDYPWVFLDLGRCYEKGIGVEVCIAKAIKQYKIASDYGSTDAKFALQRIASQKEINAEDGCQ